MPSLNKLVERLGLLFNNTSLLESALVHSSFVNERPELAQTLVSVERLEFLGDSVLNYIAADLVYARFPAWHEGELTVLRTELIKTTTLAGFARELDLGSYLRLSKGEEKQGAREREALLADTFEALVAAIYLDRGLDTARAFLAPLLERQIAEIEAHGLRVDYKTRLLARVQAERNITPLYQVVAVTGPDHRREFSVEVRAGEELLGRGQGPSKQAATQDAACRALEALDRASR
ncbi:MAG TPA: ribonuclease III [Roseiflexaceae bacterium]|nr:ribonuclease III [Roseiflexaceae bacterium]